MLVDMSQKKREKELTSMLGMLIALNHQRNAHQTTMK